MGSVLSEPRPLGSGELWQFKRLHSLAVVARMVCENIKNTMRLPLRARLGLPSNCFSSRSNHL